MTDALTAAERLAAYLILPDRVPRPPADELPDAAAFRELVEAHKLPLKEVLDAGNLADDPAVAAPCVQEVLAEDRARHDRIRDEFVAFRERFDEAGIAHVLVKAIHGVPYRSDNIDVLVPSEEVPRAEQLLADLGYVYNRYRPERLKRLHNRVEGGVGSGMVHLHKAVGWYSLFVEGGLILRGAVDGSEAGVRRPGRETALAIIGAHALYEDAAIRLIDFHKILCLLRSGPVDWPRLWRLADTRGFASGLALFFLILDAQHRRLAGAPLFDDAQRAAAEARLSALDGTKGHYRRHVAGRDLPSGYTLSKYFVRRCLFLQVRRTRLVGAWRKVRTTALILAEGVKQVLKYQPQPPMLVAVCGPDGCGKTTQIERLASSLFVFEIKAERSWIRIGDSPILNRLKHPFRGRVRAEVEAGQVSQQGVFRNRAVRAVWPVVAIADYLLRQYLAVAWGFLREKVVIADRYHVDALVDLAMRCGPEVFEKRWIAAALRLLPPAGPVFVLRISEGTMRRRRGDDYIEGISERMIAYYDQAIRVLGGRVLSGEDDIDAITDTMVRETLDRFFVRL